jgi:hypothetical protein
MSEPTEIYYKSPLLADAVIYIGECCREWPMHFGAPSGSCGICGEVPTFKRWDDDSA